MQRVRVGVVVASRDGVWACPVSGEGLDARAWYEVFEGETFEGLTEFAEEIAERIGWPEHDDVRVDDVALVRLDGDPGSLAVFLAVTDAPDLAPHPDLRRFDGLETGRLQRRTTDVALAIALRHLEVVGLRGDHRSPWGPEQTMPERSTALALLHERPSDDGALWTATYVCEVSGGGTVVRGPAGASPAEALAWGRSHAETVLFFVGDRPGRPWPTVPEPLELAPRPARPEHHVTYGPLPGDQRTGDPSGGA